MRLPLPLLCALLCLFVALHSACTKSPSPPAPESTLRISQRNEPADLDPATASLPDEFFIIRALGEPLFSPASSDPSAIGIRPSSFPSLSPDALTYTFHLRPDALWSNGEPLTAADYLASYRRALDPATAAPKAHLFFAVKNARAFATGALADFSAVGFRAPDPHTLVVTLARPTPDFLLYAASGPWIPVNPRVVAAHGRTWTDPAHHVGNGPFVLAEWRPHQRILVRRNPRYHTPAAVRLDAIAFVRFDNDDTEERAFRAGQIDVTLSVPRTKLDVYAAEHPAELHRAPLAETRYLVFNTARPALADPLFRRALSLAIDREKLVARVLRGGQSPATALLPPALLPLYPSSQSHPSHLPPSPATSASTPRLELSAWSPSQTPILEAIQAMWREQLGLDVAIVIRDAKVHLAALQTGDFDIAFSTTVALLDVADPVSLLENFTSTSPSNQPRWRSPEFDRLVASAAIALDPAARTALLSRAEQLLLASAPIAPLYFNTRNFLLSARVRDWHEDALWTRNYLGTHLDRQELDR